MADVTGSALRGFIVPDDRLTIWEAQSSYTQADPQPGAIEADSSDSRLALACVGDLDAETGIVIQTQQSGHAEPGGGGFVWRHSADSTSTYRGADPPSSISGYELIEGCDGTGAGVRATADPHAVVLPNQTIVCVYQDQTLSNKRVRVRTRARDGAWSSATTIHSGVVVALDYHPGAVLLPDGSVLIAFWVNDSAAEEANINIWRSTDDGASWSIFSEAALDVGVSTAAGSAGFALRRIRMGHLDGQILLIADVVSNDTGRTWRDTYIQAASDSLGGRFVVVETGGSALFVSMPDVLATSRGFVLTYLATGATITKQAMRLIPDAFTPLSTVAEVTVSDTDLRMGELDGTAKYADDADGAACIGPAGELYVLNRATSDGSTTYNDCAIRRSFDGGETWQGMGLRTIGSYSDLGSWYALEDSNTYPRNFCAAFVEGRIVVITNHAGNPTTTDDSLSAIYLGGASTVTLPGQRATRRDTNRSSFGLCWLPWDVLTDTVFNGTGAATTEEIDVSGGYFSFEVAAAQNRYYHVDSSMGGFDALDATQAQGMIVRLGVQVTEGGTSGSSDRLYCELRLADGSAGYRVSLRMEATGFALWDTIAGSRIGDAVAPAVGALEFLIALGAGKAALWWRQRTNHADRVWTVGPSSTSLSDAGAAYSSNRLEIGSKATAGVTAAMRIFELHASAGSSAGTGLHEGFTNPDDLFAVTYAGSGVPGSYIDHGVSITARGGPAFRGESFALASAYGYPASRLQISESPTPRVKWRATGEAASSFAYSLDSSNPSTVAHGLSDTLALCVLGANWRTGKLQGYDGGAWVDLATIDASTGLTWSSAWARYGNTLRPAPAATPTGTYLIENELAGATAIFNGKYRRIASNTEGSVIDSSTAGRRACITLEGMDGTEGAGPHTVQIVPKDWVVLVNLKNARYSAYRVSIDAHTGATVDGWIETGNIMIGWVRYFGHQYSRGRVQETQPNTRSHESSDWVTRTATQSPPRRIVDVAWVEGVDTSQIHNDSAVPDYVIASENTGAKAASTARGTPHTIEGIFSRMYRDGGPENPGHVVYLPSVDPVAAGASDVIHLTRRHQFMAGRVDGPIRLESYIGNENDGTSGEVIRVASIAISEIV